MGPNSALLLKEWPDGVYAEKVCLPADCIIPIRPDPGIPPSVLCRLGWLGTAYAALKKAGMHLGDTVAVNGASGNPGANAVVTVLALGASRVFAVGRRQEALDAMSSVDSRVVTTRDVAAIPLVDVAYQV